MNIEIDDNEIWDAVKDEVQDKIMDNISDIEIQSSDDVAEIMNQEFQYCLEDNRYIVEDICDSMIDYKIEELDTSPINQAIHDLEQKISKLQSQLKLANFKLRRSK